MGGLVGVGAACIGGGWMEEGVIEGCAVRVEVGGLAVLLVDDMLRLV